MRAFAAHNQQLGFFTFPSQEALRIFLEAHSSFLNWSGTSFRLLINCSDGNILRAAEIVRWLRAPSSPSPRAAILLIHPPRASFKDIPTDKRLIVRVVFL